MAELNKEEKDLIIERLVTYANTLGYGVDLEANYAKYPQLEMDDYDPDDKKKKGPSGMCCSHKNFKMILIREGKGRNGKITSLVHELVHAHHFKERGIRLVNTPITQALDEWECESIAHFVTQLLGVDRRDQTESHVIGYVGEPTFLTTDQVKDLTLRIYGAAVGGEGQGN